MREKILFFLMNGVGGCERITVTISNYFDLSKYDIKYVLVQNGDDAICHFMNPDLPIIRLPRRRIYLSTYPIYKILKKERPQVVFCASPAINARLIIAAKMLGGIRVVVRNSNMYSFERKDVRLLMKMTYLFADKIILQQDEMREDLLTRMPRLRQEQLVTLHNPIDKRHITEGMKAPNPYYLYKDNINYLWVARFAHEKAQDVLVRAFKTVHRQQPEAHLWLVGRYNPDNAFASSVLSYVKDNELGEYVHFVGHDDNPYKWMRYCSCFVLPSRFEGLPNVLIEAMYLGRPVVATRCLKIIREMVEEGQNGYTCEVNDAEELASKMMKAVDLRNCKMIYKPAREEDFINQIIGS